MTQAGSSLVHRALLYDTPDQFLAAAVPFVTEGLNRGDSVIAVTSDVNADLLRQRLNGGADRVTFLQAAQWYDAPGRTLAAYHSRLDQLAEGSTCLRVIGEPIWTGLDPLETTEWGRYESVVNVSLAACPVWIMCGYDRRSLPTSVVDDARRTHPELAIGELFESSETYADPASYYAEHNGSLTERPSSGVEWLPITGDLVPMRAFVALHAARLGLPADQLDDFLLSVNEVATNALRHGGGHGDVRLWATERRVICEVSDSGGADDKFLGFLRPDPHGERGHGLWIARQLCDLLEIHTGGPGTTVRIHMRKPISPA
jgi:anti-sigma regulatory factor (Ser/Thr protein kinase)